MRKDIDGRREKYIYYLSVVRFIHGKLENDRNKVLKWVEDGRAFEVCGKVGVPDALDGSKMVKMKRRDLEDILFTFGFQKREYVNSHIYFHRYFRKGEDFDEDKMYFSYIFGYEYTGGFLCPDAWERGDIDVQKWYKHMCNVYESIDEMLNLQSEIIKKLWEEIAKLVRVGIERTRILPEPRRCIVRGPRRVWKGVEASQGEKTVEDSFVEVVGRKKRERIQKFV
ncbi:uncharacterized protein Eint_040460 [Encephalitozoon intestinalis ATCC 50506]|uniref:Uncharacterized protein n=1 Tax=Encephalitozoon intestinalis (strain ATCC 50506) TaxID=876142 RepID=E0S6K1_ENCIT|nr:uncharacterized protein Eint_040460 [Encephalitozoon intestinalis ATCC 50506]ADM11336.1 hypothetical protein Eint_040460 [Encephalitozoon intestinalis ATCC 50506]UTX45024.1 hypothetical protein GPK93_04g05600 [Encephalitozoon intestinalis]